MCSVLVPLIRFIEEKCLELLNGESNRNIKYHIYGTNSADNEVSVSTIERFMLRLDKES